MASLKDKSENILSEKQLNLLPENIKKDITIFGVTGTYDNSSGVKLFETIDEMNSDTNAKEGDLAVVYRSEITNMTSDSVISSITFPEQVVLVEALTDSVYCRLRAENSSVMFDGNIMLDENSFRFDSFTDSGMIMVEYSSDDGITYTRTRFEGDSGDLTNPVDLGTNVIVENADEWSDIIGQFILVGGNIFEGLFNYKKVDTDNQLTLNPMSLDISDESINLIQAGPILDYAILKNAATYLSQFYDDELQFDAYIDYENKVHIVYAKSGFNSLAKIFIINKDNPIIYMGDKAVDEPVEHFDAIYNNETKTFENEQKITFTKMFTNINLQGFYCTKINGYPICAIGISNNDYNSWRHFNHTIYYLDTIDSSTNININDTKLKLNEMVTKYVIAPNQFTANSNNLYNAIAYGKDGIINGNITNNVSNSFADINAEIYYKLQNVYDNMEPRVLTDEDKTIDKNIYFIPTKSDGTPLLDTSNVTNMSEMFLNCSNLTTIPLLNTSQVTDISDMFHSCSRLVTIPLLDTSGVTNMSGMFRYCSDLTTVPLLDTSEVTTTQGMFLYCRNLTTIPQLDTSSVTNMNNMFCGCSSLTTISLLNTNQVTDMSYMFGNCTNLTAIPQLNTSSVTNMKGMFDSCSSLTTIPQLDTSSVTDMSYMFLSCSNLVSIPQLDTSSVTTTQGMFGGCSSLTTIPLLDTSKVTNMENMFGSCSNLTTIPLLDTSKVTNMSHMFHSCSSLTTMPQLDTSSVTTTQRMFEYCPNLTTIPQLNTSSVTDMYNMFYECPNLSDESLNNILFMCTNAVNATYRKTLAYVGLTEEQAQKCTTLSNYQAFTEAGWTTGY